MTCSQSAQSVLVVKSGRTPFPEGLEDWLLRPGSQGKELGLLSKSALLSDQNPAQILLPVTFYSLIFKKVYITNPNRQEAVP